MKAHRGKRYCSTLSLTSALDGGGWSTPCPGRFTPGKESRHPLYRRVGEAQGRSGRVRKISPPPGSDSRTVQPAANRYTDYAIPAHKERYGRKKTRCTGLISSRYSIFSWCDKGWRVYVVTHQYVVSVCLPNAFFSYGLKSYTPVKGAT